MLAAEATAGAGDDGNLAVKADIVRLGDPNAPGVRLWRDGFNDPFALARLVLR